jgi:hypothetical protein
MTKTIAMITAAMVLSTSVNAQKTGTSSAKGNEKYVVANAYEEAGCEGKRTDIAAVPTGKCFYAQTECETNKDLAFACAFLDTLTFGRDVSFIANCNSDGAIEADAWKGSGCKGEKIGGKALSIPIKTCVQDFEMVCSNDPKFVIRGSSNSATSTNVGILGFLGLLVI